MQNEVTVNGLTFVPYLSAAKIQARVSEIAESLKAELKDGDPVFLCILNGAFMFAADLLRMIGCTDGKIQFLKYSSYSGTESTGTVKTLIGLSENISGKDVVIIEDIVDTGLTAEKLLTDIKSQNPRSVRFVTLLHKPESSKNGFVPDYAAFRIPPKFIIGYGLDLDGKARNLPDIYVIKEE